MREYAILATIVEACDPLLGLEVFEATLHAACPWQAYLIQGAGKRALSSAQEALAVAKCWPWMPKRKCGRAPGRDTAPWTQLPLLRGLGEKLLEAKAQCLVAKAGKAS